jgi:hypothetical protein
MDYDSSAGKKENLYQPQVFRRIKESDQKLKPTALSDEQKTLLKKKLEAR